jgi:hypothetical protein
LDADKNREQKELKITGRSIGSYLPHKMKDKQRLKVRRPFPQKIYRPQKERFFATLRMSSPAELDNHSLMLSAKRL